MSQVSVKTDKSINIFGTTIPEGQTISDNASKWIMVQPGYGLELEKKRLEEERIMQDPVKRLARMRHGGNFNTRLPGE